MSNVVPKRWQLSSEALQLKRRNLRTSFSVRKTEVTINVCSGMSLIAKESRKFRLIFAEGHWPEAPDKGWNKTSACPSCNKDCCPHRPVHLSSSPLLPDPPPEKRPISGPPRYVHPASRETYVQTLVHYRSYSSMADRPLL